MPKIAFQGHFPVKHEELLKQIAHAKTLGFPYVCEQSQHDRTLAVVGGGPSVVSHLDDLRNHDDIWALNGACGWLRERGIESTLFTLDPCDFLAPRVIGARKALMSSRCHPKVFEALKGCDVTLFDIAQDTPGGEGVWGSVSSVMSVFSLAPFLGYRNTVFYGCEGSFSGDSHIYMNDPDCHDYRFVVEIGGEEYITAPDLYAQCLEMSKLLRFTNDSFIEKSGGLLRAMVEQRKKYGVYESMEIVPEHDITKVSRALLNGLKPLSEAA